MKWQNKIAQGFNPGLAAQKDRSGGATEGFIRAQCGRVADTPIRSQPLLELLELLHILSRVFGDLGPLFAQELFSVFCVLDVRHPGHLACLSAWR